MDVGGWDLRKALQLLCRSNPALSEWLQSPIVYRDVAAVSAPLRALADAAPHRHAARFHYLSLARSQYGRFIRGRETVRLKKYFYSLRPALALLWLRSNRRGLVPMSLPRLLDGVSLGRDLGAHVEALLDRKMRGGELGEGPRCPPIDQFVEDEVARAERRRGGRRRPAPGLVRRADALFQGVVLGGGAHSMGGNNRE